MSRPAPAGPGTYRGQGSRSPSPPRYGSNPNVQGQVRDTVNCNQTIRTSFADDGMISQEESSNIIQKCGGVNVIREIYNTVKDDTDLSVTDFDRLKRITGSHVAMGWLLKLAIEKFAAPAIAQQGGKRKSKKGSKKLSKKGSKSHKGGKRHSKKSSKKGSKKH